MCARFGLTTTPYQFRDLFEVDEDVEDARLDIAPTDPVSIVALSSTGGRTVLRTSWGFRPSWNMISGKLMINVRSETARSRASFKRAFEVRRCLIASTGFYEWQDGRRYVLRRPDRKIFAMAGIFEVDENQPTCAVLTTDAVAPVSQVQDRMPVLLARDQFDAWLSLKTPMPEIQSLCEGLPFGLDLQEVDRKKPEIEIKSARQESQPPLQSGLF